MIHRFVIHDPDTWLVEYQGLICDIATLTPIAVTEGMQGFDIPGALKLEPTPGGLPMFEWALYVDDTQLSPAQLALVHRSLTGG